MRQISIRLPDGQDQRLRDLAQRKTMPYSVCLRQLLEVGEQVEGTTHHQQKLAPNTQNPSLNIKLANVIFENHYLMRYLIEKIFKEEGKQAKKIARDKAAKVVDELVGNDV